MKFVIQRVKNASCTVDNQVIGEIQQGFCVFIGVSNEDNSEIADKMIRINLRNTLLGERNQTQKRVHTVRFPVYQVLEQVKPTH